MNNFRLIFILMGFINTINSCQSNHSTNQNIPLKECITLNDNAVVHIQNYGEKNRLDLALDFLKQAIKCDSNYFIAYSNIVLVYDERKDYDKEIAVVNKLLTITKNDPGILVKKGTIFEKKKEIDSAKKMYALANSEYNRMFVKYPNRLSYIEGEIILKAITNGKDSAKKELDVRIKLNPNLSTELFKNYEILNNFDRQSTVGSTSLFVSLSSTKHGSLSN